MRVVVLLNAGAGSVPGDAPGDEARRIGERFREAGIVAEVRVVPGDELTAAASGASGTRGVDAVVAGGGDGTIGAVAAGLVGGATPLGVLPLGTLNHFARDLGIPDDIGAAIALVAGGKVRTIDAGEVNGRIFLNASSVGMYPFIVRRRDRQRHRFGKWPAAALAAVRVLRLFPETRLHLSFDGTALVRRTPFLIVSNNRYRSVLLESPRRERLDGGQLWLYMGHRTGRAGILLLAIRSFLGLLDEGRDVEARPVRELRVDGDARAFHVALDGEVAMLSSPLRYRILTGALRVIAPPDAA